METNRCVGAAVVVEDLAKAYGSGKGTVTALQPTTLSRRAGEFTSIMGPSGSGKSTLMHLMAGLDAPSSGRVWLGGDEVSGLDDDALTVLRRRRVGFVFQAFNLVPTMDVRANVLLPLLLDGRRIGPPELVFFDRLVADLGLETRVDHRPHELSGGQQQRVAIARALIMEPAVVFADEPTGNLDSRSGREVLALLREVSVERGQSVVMVTHDPVAAAHADRVVYLADGRVVRDAPAESAEQIASRMLSMEVVA